MIRPTSSRAESPIILPNNNPPVGRIQAIIDRIVAAVQWFFGLCFPCCRPAHMDLLADFSRDEQLIPLDLRPLPPPPNTRPGILRFPHLDIAASARPASLSLPPAATAVTPAKSVLTSPPPAAATAAPARPVPTSPPPLPDIVRQIWTISTPLSPCPTPPTFELDLPLTTVVIFRDPNTYSKYGTPLVQAQRKHARLTTAYYQVLTAMVQKVSSPNELFGAVEAVRLSVNAAAASLASQAQDGETYWPQLNLQSELENLTNIASLWLHLDQMSTLTGRPLLMAGIFFHASVPARRIEQMPDSMATKLIPLYDQSSRIMEEWNSLYETKHPDYQPFLKEVERINQTVARAIGRPAPAY